MVLVEAGLAFVELTDAGLYGLEVRLRLLRTGGGLVDRIGEPGHRLVDRLDAGAQHVHLAREPREALAAVGDPPAPQPNVPARRFGARLLRRGHLGAGYLQRARATSRSATNSGLRGSHPSASASSMSGSAPAVGGRLDVEVPPAFRCNPYGRVDPFGQRRQPEPRLLRALGALASGSPPPVRAGQLGRSGLQSGGSLVMLPTERGLRIADTREFVPPGHQIVGR